MLARAGGAGQGFFAGDNLPMPAEVRDWLQAFVDAHYTPAPKRRQRPASFIAPEHR